MSSLRVSPCVGITNKLILASVTLLLAILSCADASENTHRRLMAPGAPSSGVKFSLSSSTGFPDRLDDIQGWMAYGVVRRDALFEKKENVFGRTILRLIWSSSY